YERLLHEALEADALIPLCGPGTEHARALLEQPLLERAIGVIYRPESERVSHYFHAALSRQFDIVLHHDHTHAVRPLEHTPAWSAGELPETYPSAL
ncbi:MAG TPA: erythromycin esterase family protein, partial [Gemmatimonadaceae bacterium]|nr:erythromycin esterase family protein [Gemmatimonadaceae bacterium]